MKRLDPQVDISVGSQGSLSMLKADDLLAGSSAVYDITIPTPILSPGSESAGGETGCVRLRPINLHTLTLISRASRDDSSLTPLLMIKESLVEPALTLDQIRQLHLGLVYFLVGQINRISGLTEEGELITQTLDSPLGRTHFILAKHFGWTPEQVSQLTPGQVAVYLAGIERLLQLEQPGE
jgi:hypothetical protein